MRKINLKIPAAVCVFIMTLAGPVGHSAVPQKLTAEREAAVLKKAEIELIEAVMKDFPNNEAALKLVANFHSRHSRRAEAVKLWQQCLDINPRQLSMYRSLGEMAFDAGDCEKAIEQYKKAVEVDPNAAGIHKGIGHALVELGRYDEAIEELKKEIQISPGSLPVHFLLGQAYLAKKQYNEAREHYEKAIQLDPEYERAYYGLVRVYAALQEPEKAKEYELMFKSLRDRRTEKLRAGRVGKLSPILDLAAIRKSVIITYLDAEKLYRAMRDFGRAEALLKRAVMIDPNNSKCFERLGLLYSMTQRYPEALRQFERIREIEPSNPRSHLNVGTILLVLNRYDEAEIAYRKVIAIAPEQSQGYLELARLYLKTYKRLEEARKLAQKAISLEASPKGYFILSWACGITGDQNGALKAIEQAIRLEPKNAKYRQIYERIKSSN